ncbi:CCA tRNA nucleotidyltransferase [Mesobacterium sp. TK19101]|uniref:CCA tRNA nucleotidyltransferase n=1 Tax=Mesobacterium hydrothermale TaxID=3111907 RepID=A0ABU6HDY9_9RHOB|nr:CCA tRNA nucleotidyltransferase [Mesobacterium sp. TK19101]MEC3860683.1 CCA tRNA nucleotidyltransferase [Mesobacterium sp. TK19101]
MKVTGDWLTRPQTQTVMALLESAGHLALLVGGCVRNALLGAPVDDIDISTDARPEQVIALARAAGLKPVPTGIDHGTITVVADGIPHEITTFRADIETDGRRAVVRFADDVSEDALRRDFTMNALYADRRGTIVDPLGGLPDLIARRVRFIQNADTRIREDYLRILRFFRFTAWYGNPDLGFDPDALDAIARNLDGLATLSRERVGAELKKLLRAPDPAPAAATMAQTGVLPALIPGADARALAPLVHLEQGLGAPPGALRRLAAIGAFDGAALRLSKAEQRQLSTLQDLIGSVESPEELGYRHGPDTARDVVLLRAAMLGGDLPPRALARIATGAQATCPVTARDLQPGLQGAALGQRLKHLEALWIASNFTLGRDDLLAL